MKKIYVTPGMLVISTFSNESIANAVVDGNATMVGKTSKNDILYDKGSDKTTGTDIVDAKDRPWGDLWE